jgi:hypothetical protein
LVKLEGGGRSVSVVVVIVIVVIFPGRSSEGARRPQGTYQFLRFVHCSFGAPYRGLALLACKLWYLVQLLVQVCLDELELGFIVAE